MSQDVGLQLVGFAIFSLLSHIFDCVACPLMLVRVGLMRVAPVGGCSHQVSIASILRIFGRVSVKLFHFASRSCLFSLWPSLSLPVEIGAMLESLVVPLLVVITVVCAFATVVASQILAPDFVRLCARKNLTGPVSFISGSQRMVHVTIALLESTTLVTHDIRGGKSA